MQQYYSNPYPNYYNTPYDGSGPYNGYTPYSQTQPAAWNAPTPYAANSGLPPPMQLQPGTAPPAPTAHRSSHRRRATMPSNGTASKSFKSALKQNGSGPPMAQTPSNPTPLRRKRALSNPNRDYTAMPTSADYTAGYNNNGFHLDADESAYMFVSFHGNNELRIENLAKKAMEEIRSEIFTTWPAGLILDELENTQWRVRFQGAPWSLQGGNQEWVYKMLVKLFTLFEERGFSYNTTIDVGSPSPRLHFIATQQSMCKFFVATITNKGRTFTMVNPPMEVARDFTAGLQSALPGRTSRNENDVLGSSILRIVELRKRDTNGQTPISSTQFHCQLFRILDNIGYSLCATLPMARKGPLASIGYGTRQELLVFKSTTSSPVY